MNRRELLRAVVASMVGTYPLYHPRPALSRQGKSPVPRLGEDVVVDPASLCEQVEEYRSGLQRYLVVMELK